MKKFLFFLFCYNTMIFSVMADVGGTVENKVIGTYVNLNNFADGYVTLNGFDIHNIDSDTFEGVYTTYEEDYYNTSLMGYGSIIYRDKILGDGGVSTSSNGFVYLDYDVVDNYCNGRLCTIYSDGSNISNYTYSNNGLESRPILYEYEGDHNTNTPSQNFFGGAVALYDVRNDTAISNTSFEGNNITGGGVYLSEEDSNPDTASNYVKSRVAGYRFGGALANFINKDYTLSIDQNIFSGNYIKLNDRSHSEDLYTHINNSDGHFILNDNMKMNVELAGGAVFNSSNMTINNSTFENNYIDNADNNYNAFGGAIANRGGILTITDTSFFNNTVYNSSEQTGDFDSGSVHGGAIANYKGEYDEFGDRSAGFYSIVEPVLESAPTLNIVAKDKDVVFQGNGVRQATSGDFTSNALYNANGGIVNLEANAGLNIIFYDGIDGDETGSINVNKNLSSHSVASVQSVKNSVMNTTNVGSGTVIIANTVKNNNLRLYSGTVQLGTSTTDESSFATANKYFDNAPITVYGNSTLSTQNGKIDSNSIDLGNISFNNGTSVLSLAMDVDLANGTSDSITGHNNGTAAQIVLNNITILNDLGNSNKYTFNLDLGNLANDITYDFEDSISSNLFEYDLKYENGILSLTRNTNSINKTVYNQAISMRALSRVQHDLTESILSRDTNLKFDSNTRKLVFAKKKAEKTNDSNSNVWLDIFGNKQDVKYNVISNTEEDYFSAVLGVSSDVYKLDNGITTYGNIYLGYLNGNQKYTDHNKIQNDGFYVGTSVLADYNDLLFGFTANFGYVDNEASNSSGKDNYDNYWLTLGTKFAYNWNVGGSYFLEPGINFSYVSMKNDSYTSKLGVRIDEDNLNSFQVSPALRFTKIFEGNSSLSLKVRYVIELVKDLKAKVGDFNINELGNGHYVEYGLSYDDIITDWFAINLELDRRDGDVRGWTGGANFKFMF